MPTITRFEDLEAWQVARQLTRLVYVASDRGTFSRDFGLRDQMRRAAVSVLSNIAEGFERDGTREFRQFLSQAKGSVGELRAQLYVARDADHISEAEFSELFSLATRASQLIAGLIRYLERTNIDGLKFREDGFTYGVKPET